MSDLNFNMKINQGIEKVNPQGSGYTAYYQNTKKTKKDQQLKKFRIGEILQGKIIDTDGGGIGKVRLPSGIFTCSLHKGLVAGDVLFFKIAEVEPTLVLKVHSVQSYGQNGKLGTEDIIRILDLPKLDIFKYSAIIFLNFRNMIYKEDLLKFYKFYTQIPNSEEYDGESIASTLFWMAESGLHFEFDLFNHSYKYFKGLKEIDFILNKFFLIQYPRLQERLKTLISPHKNEFFAFPEDVFQNIDYFSKEKPDSEINFYSLIHNLSNSHIDNELGNTPSDLLDFLDSMHLWNSICNGSNAAYHWSFPFKFHNRTYIITLVIRSQFSIADTGNRKSNINEIDVGSVLKGIFTICKNKFHQEGSIKDIKSLPQMINQCLDDNGLTLLAIIYYDKRLITIESPKGSVLTTNRSISFVV